MAEPAAPDGGERLYLDDLRVGQRFSSGTHLVDAEEIGDQIGGPDDALSTATSQSRRSLLLRLQRSADRALADATNAACAVLAGWRPA